ncbi:MULTISPECIES: endonuclease domain-containing protein [unclassified Streptomyces]|uniref:endonuclease domain-containing protein n=1 Tax=unclassified Streptomyces TaxID=2593676 RepID=UPI0020A6C468|nr:endonuclease domain-containing protein [Streptomyces sp. CNQ-509]
MWVEPGRVPDLRLRLRVAQAGRPELVVSHSAAAHLLGVEVLAVRPEFTHVRSRGRAPEGCLLHRTALSDDEIVSVAGLRVTDASRTLVDLLRTAERDAALVAVESALTRRPLAPGGGWPRRWREQVTDLHAVSEALAGIGQRRGVVQARQRLALVDPRSGSPAETVARLRMYDAGLRPLSQVPFTAPNGRRIRVDFFFPVAGLVVEIEGYGFHGGRAAHRADVERFNDLGRCPEVRRMLRFTAADAFERPQRMLHAIRAALGEIAAGGSHPADAAARAAASAGASSAAAEVTASATAAA